MSKQEEVEEKLLEKLSDPETSDMEFDRLLNRLKKIRQ